jgi:hypothetical protein
LLSRRCHILNNEDFQQEYRNASLAHATVLEMGIRVLFPKVRCPLAPMPRGSGRFHGSPLRCGHHFQDIAPGDRSLVHGVDAVHEEMLAFDGLHHFAH